MTKTLPASLPVDRTPRTYSGTKLKGYLLDMTATTIVLGATLTLATAVAAAATTASISSSEDVTLPAGTKLDFGGVILTVGNAAEPLTSTASSVTITAAPAAVAQGTTAIYTNAPEIPLTEENMPSLADDEETIKVQGRPTPIRVMNGKDLTASLKTIAGIDDPVVKRLVAKGAQLSPNNQERLLWIFDDGFAILALCNIGAPKPEGRTGTAQRYNFSANLAGDAYWADLNEVSPEWQKIGAL